MGSKFCSPFNWINFILNKLLYVIIYGMTDLIYLGYLGLHSYTFFKSEESMSFIREWCFNFSMLAEEVIAVFFVGLPKGDLFSGCDVDEHFFNSLCRWLMCEVANMIYLCLVFILLQCIQTHFCSIKKVKGLYLSCDHRLHV